MMNAPALGRSNNIGTLDWSQSGGMYNLGAKENVEEHLQVEGAANVVEGGDHVSLNEPQPAQFVFSDTTWENTPIFTFFGDDTTPTEEIIRVDPDGRIFIRGQRATSLQEVEENLKAWNQRRIKAYRNPSGV